MTNTTKLFILSGITFVVAIPLAFLPGYLSMFCIIPAAVSILSGLCGTINLVID